MLEDEAQRLYQQADFDLGDAVKIRCSYNFRGPQVICDMINKLSLIRPPIRSLNRWTGEVPGIRPYAFDEELLSATIAAVNTLLARGFALEDIVIVSGRKRSVLLNRVMIGNWRTCRFTGEYDRNGEPR